MNTIVQPVDRYKSLSIADSASADPSVEASAEDPNRKPAGSQPGPSVIGSPPYHKSANAPAIALRSIDQDRKEPADKARPAIDGPEQASHQATLSLDLERLERMEYVVPGSRRSPMAAQFGEIKRPLLTNARSERAVADRLALIMVTSAMPNEGKTFCAINLAISMSLEIDTSVLLVDADVNGPGLLQLFPIRNGPGLLDLLTDRQLDVSDVVFKTNVPKLSILPAGVPRNLSSELLASDAMDELLLSLIAADPNRVVIFDAPPLLVTTEAKVLAARVGQVVMIVAAASTRRSALVEAFAKVEHCPIVMSVMNKARTPEISLGYGY